MPGLADAIVSLKRGNFVVLHDGEGRENEADLLLLATKATPAKIRALRKDAGGLICLATGKEDAARLELRFECDTLSKSCSPTISGMGKKRMGYGDMPAFTISINHLSTFTGITDNDRAKTIKEFGKLVAKKSGAREFAHQFRAIGHVFLLASRGLEERRGHTELSVELARMADAAPAVVLCEMLSDTGRAASKKEAMAYAKEHNIPFISGKDVIGAYYGKGKAHKL